MAMTITALSKMNESLSFLEIRERVQESENFAERDGFDLTAFNMGMVASDNRRNKVLVYPDRMCNWVVLMMRDGEVVEHFKSGIRESAEAVGLALLSAWTR